MVSVKDFQSKIVALDKYRAQIDQEGRRRASQDCDEIAVMCYSNSFQALASQV